MNIAYCGIKCDECKAYIATINDDDDMRQQVADETFEKFNVKVNPKDINCMGCRSEGNIHLGYCNVCQIRKCAMEKQYENCAYCDDYDSCETLNSFLEQSNTKETLDNIRAKL